MPSKGKAIAALSNHILHIVLRRTEEKMGRVYTGRIITTVADKEAVRDRSKMDKPRGAVGLYRWLLTTASAYTSIAIFGSISHPYPACIRLANFRPKAVSKGLCASVPFEKTQRLAFNASCERMVSSRDFSGLTAAAFTEVSRCDILRLHRKLTPFVAIPRALARRWALCCLYYTTEGGI